MGALLSQTAIAVQRWKHTAETEAHLCLCSPESIDLLSLLCLRVVKL
jgi:hypothetical protein